MDIIFFAAIALYVFWKLREQFGNVDEDQKKRIEENISRRKELVAAVQNQVMSIQKKITEITESQKQADEKLIASIEPESQEPFRKILLSCAISAEMFMQGVKSSFEMVIKSFAGKDKETLRMLVSDKVLEAFNNAIENRISQEINLVSNVIAITDAKILAVSLVNTNATVVVKFISKQINYVTNKDGAIIEGRRDEIKELEDVWTFTKDLAVQNKNWVVSAT